MMGTHLGIFTAAVFFLALVQCCFTANGKSLNDPGSHSAQKDVQAPFDQKTYSGYYIDTFQACQLNCSLTASGSVTNTSMVLNIQLSPCEGTDTFGRKCSTDGGSKVLIGQVSGSAFNGTVGTLTCTGVIQPSLVAANCKWETGSYTFMFYPKNVQAPSEETYSGYYIDTFQACQLNCSLTASGSVTNTSMVLNVRLSPCEGTDAFGRKCYTNGSNKVLIGQVSGSAFKGAVSGFTCTGVIQPSLVAANCKSETGSYTFTFYPTKTLRATPAKNN